MAPSLLRGACVVAFLVLTKHPVLGCSEARPPRGPPYKNNKHAAFVAAPNPRAARCDGRGARSSSHERVSRRSRRHQQRPNNNNGREARSTGPSFFAGRDSRSYREEGSAGALTRLSVSASLTDIREKRRTTRPLPPPGAGGRGGGGIAGAPDLSAAPVEVIDGMDTYFQVLAANPDKIVVVKIFAGFCRACKAFDRKYRALALEYEAAGANIKFYEMDWMETRDLCKSLQVKKLPHLELYAGQRGRLESFVCGPSKAGLLKEKLDALLIDPSDPSLGTAPPPLSSAPLAPP